ncbi:hypothetical protein [Streptomyces sp. NPDC056817]|uniref:hypothetical protein n=1 Tax=Streptomyces sp. NPDC056817 TaxID=3345950 RepID=UPI00368774EE
MDPTLKFLLYAVLALAVGKMIWEWLTKDVSRWITDDLWGLMHVVESVRCLRHTSPSRRRPPSAARPQESV